MNTETINRVSDDLEAWRSREQRMEKLFSSAALLGRSFRVEKLRYYDQVIARHSGATNDAEKLDLIILRQIRGRLEKELYPNMLLRWVRRLLLLFKQPDKVGPNVMAKNYHALRVSLIKAGFNNVYYRLEQALKQGKQEFILPIAYYVKPRQAIDIQLNFSKNDQDLYSFDSYHAIIRSEHQTGESRAQTFYQSDEHQYSQVQAFNLLEGRALQVECLGLDGATHKVWQQLDLHDKDASGNFRMRSFPEDGENQVKTALENLPLKNEEDMAEIWKAIANGDRPEVLLQQGNMERVVFITADPQHRSVGIFDEQNNQLNLSTIFSKQSAKELKVVPLSPPRDEKKNRSLKP
jgi:hypothetical protein